MEKLGEYIIKLYRKKEMEKVKKQLENEENREEDNDIKQLENKENEIEELLNNFTKLDINKGKGAGGANTNKNGLSYEKLTDLEDRIKIKKRNKYGEEIIFYNNEKKFIKTKQSNFFKYMKDNIDKKIINGHGCKNPDECYIDEELKRIFIIEKKFQEKSGSVCEKIQTGEFKLWQYKRLFPEYNIVYMYCLSDWFKRNCKAELEYLDYKKISYFFGNNETYKDDIIKYIVSYK